jgi:geranylgeranyl pyrophosphate synthase
VTTLPVLYLREAAKADPAAQTLLETLERGATGDLSEDEFQEAITELRHHKVTEATMQTARDMADHAIAYLDDAPSGIVKDGLVRFAHQVVDRSY